MRIGMEWERQKHFDSTHADRAELFEYINGEFSPYLAHAVYSYTWQAIEEGLSVIRLGPATISVAKQTGSLDDFSEPAELMAPYFWETIRFDEILQAHLQMEQEESMLIVTIIN